MRNSSLLLSLALGVCLLTPSAFAQQTERETAAPSLFGMGSGVENSIGNNNIGDIEPSYVFPQSWCTATGVGLRQRKFGCLETHGIPDGVNIRKAFLYWAYIAPAPTPGIHNVMDFRRFRPGPQQIQEDFFTGELIGMGADPCWFHPGANYIWVFRADVTRAILGSPANPDRNGMYFVRPHENAQGNPNFDDPWDNPPVAPLLEGASLVIVTSGYGTVYIYDEEVPPFNKALAGNTFEGCAGITYTLDNFFAEQQTCGKFIQIGADGQSGQSCEADYEFAIERTTVSVPNSGNYLYVSGPGSEYHNSDWNGMDGNCLPQLWDTSCHDITPIFSASGASVVALDVEVRNYDCDGEPCWGGPSDCLTTIANIICVCGSDPNHRGE
jgi:hypothetical protein